MTGWGRKKHVIFPPSLELDTCTVSRKDSTVGTDFLSGPGLKPSLSKTPGKIEISRIQLAGRTKMHASAIVYFFSVLFVQFCIFIFIYLPILYRENLSMWSLRFNNDLMGHNRPFYCLLIKNCYLLNIDLSFLVWLPSFPIHFSALIKITIFNSLLMHALKNIWAW